ncbi:lipopolysaccharide biosynthesis protein [Zobellia sp. OII3]|uniref:lipopolysaccharide biosynthesis protein n=1 Tax=Zobellia sp. OII3 TaxID=2034520 RepID=UPI001F41B853|nr:MATE family efflux transporter [Zobellia sp. OII3]
MTSDFLSRFKFLSGRTKNILKHIGWSFIFKIGSVVSNFLIVPLTIDYLNTENYGVWLTISSFVSWFSFFDVGLGHGLRNKFAEAKSVGNDILARAYVSCAYFTIGIVALGLMLLFLVVSSFVDWSLVFNTGENLNEVLQTLMLIIFSFFCIQLVLKLITSVYLADQNHSINVKIEFLTRILSLFLIWVLLRVDVSSFLLYGILFSALPVLILLGLNFFAFSKKYEIYKPTISLFQVKYLKEITGIGLNFFIIQIGVLVLFSTDNFIITKIFGPSEVVPYNVAQKYFSIVFMSYSILVAPYWSAITEAYAKKEYDWIKNSIGKLQKIWFGVPVVLFIMVIFSNWFYNIWVGDTINVSMGLSASMALFTLLMTFQAIYVQFLNGISKMRLQLYVSLFSLVMNIPLSIYFGKTLNWGLSGVMLATCVSLLIACIIYPIQYFKIINNKAKGLWNK